MITLFDIYGETLGSINSPVHTTVINNIKIRDNRTSQAFCPIWGHGVRTPGVFQEIYYKPWRSNIQHMWQKFSSFMDETNYTLKNSVWYLGFE
ncbi:MAG: hypothetical protein A2X25_04925 [Chloroflexi bacterium GWB2_49_20]|nr:MAG: hypothetical protein A2X25_04925 [Chloroflexi bacterium GWB2_49_20]OGN80527.1 MAG: hypothetical protein A2X26_12035 [Chloroflexi bacterium GWC2_49_37]OGN83362.1 MAG: hypothetical protein A2X27_12210 [Chloroflexi bacterium GWD2_49_16]